jgi:hypothetical protein
MFGCYNFPNDIDFLFEKFSKVREYFNSEGFNRWNKIYSEVDDVNFVQKFIREGHQQTIDKVSTGFNSRGEVSYTAISLESEICAMATGSQVDRRRRICVPWRDVLRCWLWSWLVGHPSSNQGRSC